MPGYQDPKSGDDSLMLNRPTDITQTIASFGSNVTVTLVNPITVENATDTAANIAFQCAGDSALHVSHFLPGQAKRIAAATIGSSGNGTTATKVIIRGIQ